MTFSISINEAGVIRLSIEGELDAEGHRGTRSGWRFHGLPWVQG